MIAQKENCKQLIDFLINRWRLITNFAAIEKVYIASCQFAEANNLPIPQPSPIIIPKACRQIEVIKHRIIETLPEAHFIDYNYEAPAPLNPDTWVEMFIADHHQCISKVEAVVEKMQIT